MCTQSVVKSESIHSLNQALNQWGTQSDAQSVYSFIIAISNQIKANVNKNNIFK